MYKLCFRFCLLLPLIVLLGACEATQGQSVSQVPAQTKKGDIIFIVPPGESRQASMTSLLQNTDQSENGEIKVIRQYVAASGSVCTLMGTDVQSAASQWLACQNASGTWIVKPALLNADAVFGIVR